MEVSECFIATKGQDWTKIDGCNVHMNVKRRLQRTVIRGSEGDDLMDEGAESAVYTITGKMTMTIYKEILNFPNRSALFPRPVRRAPNESSILKYRL